MEGAATLLADEIANGKTLDEVVIDFVAANRPSSIIRRYADTTAGNQTAG